MLAYNSFRVSGLLLKPWIHSELSFVQGERYGFSFIHLQEDIKIFQHCVEEAVFFFLVYIFDTFVKS